MERATGIEPASSAWKAAAKLHSKNSEYAARPHVLYIAIVHDTKRTGRNTGKTICFSNAPEFCQIHKSRSEERLLVKNLWSG